MKKIGEGLIITAIACASIVYTIFAWGYVLHELYEWFVISSIPSMSHFTIVQFIGFRLFLGALLGKGQEQIKSEYKIKYHEWIMFVAPWTVLAFSFIIHAWLF